MERCGFDYSSQDGRAVLRQTLAGVVALQEQLKAPAIAARAGNVERMYERTLGLAVIPVLLGRVARRALRGAASRKQAARTDGIVGEIHEELFGVSTSHRTLAYERTMGLAVVPMLVRRAILAQRSARVGRN